MKLVNICAGILLSIAFSQTYSDSVTIDIQADSGGLVCVGNPVTWSVDCCQSMFRNNPEEKKKCIAGVRQVLN